MSGKLTLTVTQLCEYIRRTFQLDPMLHSVELKGEISNLKFHQTGTLFFTLKDEHAAMPCVMYASDVEGLQVVPFEGMRAVVSGSVGFYVKGGQTQFYARVIRAEGVGVLYERLLALKAKLAQEGLFEGWRKRALPVYPRTVGVVSSPTGAVIHDIISVSLRRNPQAQLLLCPVRVQGIGAADEVVQAIRLLERMEGVSVIIVARGGGSMEDLWTFNEESVVRAVASCSKPIVSAIGHETDVTLCDLAADLRAPTPSAAAECVMPLQSEITARLAAMKEALTDALERQMEKRRAMLQLLGTRLSAHVPQKRLDSEQRRLSDMRDQLCRAANRQLMQHSMALANRRRDLELLSPYRVLLRGYAMVTRDGTAIQSPGQLEQGDVVRIRFADGAAYAKILDNPQREEG